MDMHHLFAVASLRCQGVGRGFVETCKIEAITKSCRYLAVGTHPDNQEAQAFYLSLGFERRPLSLYKTLLLFLGPQSALPHLTVNL